MVKANNVATPIRAGLVSDLAAADLLGLALSSITLLDLVNAVVEKALLPLASLVMATQLPAAVGLEPLAPPMSSQSRLEPGAAGLKAALIAAEKTAIIFVADLGRTSVANRGLKAATEKVGRETGGDAAEGIRVVNDALSCIDNMEVP